jgi:uncharacterized phiE125 gp8 family phage protein
MKYEQTQPENPLLDITDVKTHLRIDGTTEDTYLEGLITAAVAHAELSMQCSLLQREITATFYAGETLNLPRGPVVSISSVSVGPTPVSEGAYGLERHGTIDLLRYNNGNIQPLAAPATLTVVYLAGYGETPDDVPADILQVIKCYVGLMYENREVATDRTFTPVPFLDEFYKLNSREPVIG